METNALDIRKADSKGRLSGFEPGEHYWIDEGGSVTIVTSVVRRYDTKIPISRAGADYLEEFGLSANNLSRDGANENGAFRFVLDSEGNRVASSNGRAKEWMPWPEGFDYEEFVRLANL